MTMMDRILIWLCLAISGAVTTGSQTAPPPAQAAQAPETPVEGTPAPAPGSTPEQAPAVAPELAPLVGLHQVFADPLAYLGRRVRVVFQVHSTPAQWNPFLTRFGTAGWVAVNTWAEHQFLWDVREYERPLGLLFAPRDSAAHAALAQAGEFSRFEATIRVDQVFLGRPWVSILELVRLRAETGRGTILHATRALDLMGSGEWRLAIDDLTRASVEDLPPAAQAELDRLRAYCEDRLAELRSSNQSRGR